MALHKNFDPSKQFRVTKTFHEGGRKYVEGDVYAPRTKVGKTKALFRHFVAGRIKQEETVSEVSTPAKKEEFSTSTSAKTETSSTTPTTSTSSKRGRKKKKPATPSPQTSHTDEPTDI
ncbi:MAG: hypothetical protein CMF22_10095 [Idiomarinaceae bacterium]|nr:hypothetical protein [Idiomarinaceae bacterium]MBG23792.1 hypothetical protein [Idiomarinaceae bacterium]|tara:strand:+ start:52015 stop:52368 length:354 start_codon:yes stop_codon:yes gene_type:complete